MATKTRIALVTGGMGGLGEAICIKLAAMGDTVVTTHSPGNAKCEQWLRSMKELGFAFHAYACDVVEWASCEACINAITRDLGPVDVLVNNAGITRDMTFKKMDKINWDAVMHTNLNSCFNMTKQVCDGMVDRGWGRVINISSVNGQKGAFGQTNYSAAKAGMHGFTKALALEVARKGCDGQHHIARLYRHENGDLHFQRNSRHQNHPANSHGPSWQTGRSRRFGGLPGERRGRVLDRSEHRDQRRPTHAVAAERQACVSRTITVSAPCPRPTRAFLRREARAFRMTSTSVLRQHIDCHHYDVAIGRQNDALERLCIVDRQRVAVQIHRVEKRPSAGHDPHVHG